MNALPQNRHSGLDPESLLNVSSLLSFGRGRARRRLRRKTEILAEGDTSQAFF